MNDANCPNGCRNGWVPSSWEDCDAVMYIDGKEQPMTFCPHCTDVTPRPGVSSRHEDFHADL